MLVRVSDPSRRTELWLFLRNSGLVALSKEGDDGVRVLANVNSRERLEEALAVFGARYPGLSARIDESHSSGG
jgi:hypothetical protein